MMSVLRYFITSKAKRSVLKLFLSHPDSAFYTREVARLTAEPLNAVRRELGYLEQAGMLRFYMKGNLKYYRVVKTFPVLAEWQKIILFTPNVEHKRVPPAADSAKHAGVSELQPDEDAVLDEEIIADLEEEDAVETVPLELEEAVDVPATGEEPASGGAVTTKQPDIITVPTVVKILRNEFLLINQITLAVVHGEAAHSEKIPEDGVDLLVVGDLPSENLVKLLTDIEDDTGVPINLVRMTRSDWDYRNAKGDPLIRRIWGQKKLIVKGRH
jgi:hypothetical protein